jgi:hypothetical protein
MRMLFISMPGRSPTRLQGSVPSTSHHSDCGAVDTARESEKLMSVQGLLPPLWEEATVLCHPWDRGCRQHEDAVTLVLDGEEKSHVIQKSHWVWKKG